jgi:hypothetical protein
MKEVVYINNGEIYTEIADVNSLETNVSRIGVRSDGDEIITSRYYGVEGSQHVFSEDNDLMQFFSVKSSNKSEVLKVKVWHYSRWYAEAIGVDKWYDTSNIDISSSIEKIIGVATIADDDEFDLFFDIKDANIMQEVADYYKLEPPLRKEDFFNTAEHNWNLFYMQNISPILKSTKLGGIRFIDGVPVMFKYYKPSA